MNNVTVLTGSKSFHDEKIHAADPDIVRIFSFEILDGDVKSFRESNEVMALLSSRAAQAYAGTLLAAGKKIKLHTLKDTVEVRIAAVFNDFPKNSHEDFDVFITFGNDAVTALNFDPQEASVYGRAFKAIPKHVEISDKTKMNYTFQPMPELYFGPRVSWGRGKAWDRNSVIILICIAGLILFLSLSSFINLNHHAAISLKRKSLL